MTKLPSPRTHCVKTQLSSTPFLPLRAHWVKAQLSSYHLCQCLPADHSGGKGERRDDIFSQVQSRVANGKLPPSLKSITPPHGGPPPQKKKKTRSDAGWVLAGCLLAVCFVLTFFRVSGFFCPKWLAMASVSVRTGSRVPALGDSSLC